MNFNYNNYPNLDIIYDNIPNDIIIKYKILYKKNNKCNDDIHNILTKTALNLDVLCNSIARQ